MEFRLSKLEDMQYVTVYPKDYKSTNKYPVIIFLHGAGTRGNNIEQLKNNAFFKEIERYEDFPFIIVAPKCHEFFWFDMMDRLKKLVYRVAETESVDNNRIYLMGNSMGGYATWHLAMSIPEMIAAIVPICGGGIYALAEKLAKVPVWAFHCKGDPVVFVEESEKMVAAVNENGGTAKLTIYPRDEHNSWVETYRNPEVFAWLLSHEKTDKSKVTDRYSSADLHG